MKFWLSYIQDRSLRFFIALAMLTMTTIAAYVLIEKRTGKKTKDFQAQAVAALSPDTEVLMVGASHFYTAINPQELSFYGMNLAAGSFNYASQFEVLKANIHKAPNVKLVVLELDHVPFTINTLNNRMVRAGEDLSDFFDLGVEIENIPSLSLIEAKWLKFKKLESLAPLMQGPKINLSAKKTKSQKSKNSSETVTGPGFKTTTATMEDFRASDLVSLQNKRPSIYDQKDLNTKALSDMIEFVENQGIEIYFVRFPRMESERDGLDEVVAVVEVATKEKVTIHDFENLKELGDDHFKDPNHLNLAGSIIFTGIFDKSMRAFASGKGIELKKK